MLDELLDRFFHKDRLALARLLSMLARGEHVDEILQRLHPPTHRAQIVAFTGSGGVGKSSLVGKLIEVIRGQGSSLAILACDPESPLTGGALLGDRLRMNAPQDDGLFIRSLAARGGRSAIADHLDAMIEVLEAFGFDVVLIETVGSGQGDTRVHALADAVVLLLQPEAGDDLQWEKAGILEVADVVFVHKADLPGAEQVEAQVRASLALSPGRMPTVLRGSARSAVGLKELWQAIVAVPAKPRVMAALDRRLLEATEETLSSRFAEGLAGRNTDLASLLEKWRHGELNIKEAVAAVLRVLPK
jgi:LAO/AO transport system kinase